MDDIASVLHRMKLLILECGGTAHTVDVFKNLMHEYNAAVMAQLKRDLGLEP